MSKKKSLGSSPIGYSSLGVDSFEFIPSIELSSENHEESNNGFDNGHGYENNYESLFSNTQEKAGNGKERSEKKIVSYYLEEDLIQRLKKVADERKMYYSTLVSNAIYCWLEQNSY